MGIKYVLKEAIEIRKSVGLFNKKHWEKWFVF